MMTKTEVRFYATPSEKNVIREFILSLEKPQQAKVRRIFQVISEYGLSSVLPHIKKLTGTPLWEIRILGKDNIRVLYVVPQTNFVLVLHGFIKKSQKTSPRELQTALNRLKDWQRSH